MTSGRVLVLGSGSPYRRKLLRRLGFAFEVVVPRIEERYREGEPPASSALRLAGEKARAVAERVPSSLVIGSDQTAEIAGRRLGKPHDRRRNVEQLRAASGRRVSFHSGLCLLDTASGRVRDEVVTTVVRFRTLSAAEVETYVDRERAFDCAGGFKWEELGIALVDSIEGPDPTALEGLPLIALARMLRREGLDPLSGGDQPAPDGVR